MTETITVDELICNLNSEIMRLEARANEYAGYYEFSVADSCREKVAECEDLVYALESGEYSPGEYNRAVQLTERYKYFRR